MPGPARAGLIVYAKDADRIAHFYESVAGMKRLASTPELIVIESNDIQLVVHTRPELPAALEPQRAEGIAFKLFFTVQNLAQARTVAEGLGGGVLYEHYKGPGFVACNGVDPEGNVFQVRESAA